MNRKKFLAASIAAALAVLTGPMPSGAQEAGIEGSLEEESATGITQKPKGKDKPRDPSKGAVTNLPIPRYASLKGREGNARRGPGLTHRIDWVFTTSGMPLRITAEFEHWRKIEDSEGIGGWVHYALLSGVRHVLVTQDLAEFRDSPDVNARVAFNAERNVIGKLEKCTLEWCQVATDGETGWIQKTALWGVDPGEILQ